jgi:hypothetical protein
MYVKVTTPDPLNSVLYVGPFNSEADRLSFLQILSPPVPAGFKAEPTDTLPPGYFPHSAKEYLGE